MPKFSAEVRRELGVRYREQELAQLRLAAYLLGVLNALGIPHERYLGFDDDGTIILSPEPDPE